MSHPLLIPLLAEAKSAGCMYPYAYAAGALAVRLDLHQNDNASLRRLLTRLHPAIADVGLKTAIDLALSYPPK